MRLKVSKLSLKFKGKDNWNGKPGHPFAVINGYNSGDITVGSGITRTKICLQIVNQMAYVLSAHFLSSFFRKGFYKIVLCGSSFLPFFPPSHLLSLISRNLSREISLSLFSLSDPLRECFHHPSYPYICIF